MQTAQQTFSIGEVAKILGLSIETLRRWDRSGKIKVAKTAGGKRFFTSDDLELLKAYIKNRNRNRQDLPLDNSSQKSFVAQSPVPSQTIVNRILLSAVLLLVILSSYLFTLTPYPNVLGEKVSAVKGQAVLGVESFIAPALEESAPLGSFLSRIGSLIGENPVSSFVIALVQRVEQPILSDNLNVKGNALVSKDIEGLGNLKISGTATVGKLVTGIVDPYLIENDGTVQPQLEIRTAPSNSLGGGLADIIFEPGGIEKLRIKENGNVVFGNSSLFGINTISTSSISNTSSVSTGTLTTTGGVTVGTSQEIKKDLTVDGNITLTGVINGNTLSSTSLVFSGNSPSIYPSTTNTGISLNGNGTGAINIGNSSTGDIYLGGGTTSTKYCLISNSSANLNCTGDITAGGNLYTTGGYIKTTATTGNLFNTTATTLNIGGAATAISIGASTGTTTINNAETVIGALTGSSTLSITGTSTLTGGVTAQSTLGVTGATTLSSTLGVTGTTSLNGAVNIGSATSNDIAVNGRITTSIIPKTTGSVDLGSSSLKFNNLYSNTINTASINTSGQGVFNLNPASTAITDASLLINPTTVSNAGSALLGIAVAGVEKARIDETGKLTLQGGLNVAGGTVTLPSSSITVSSLSPGTAGQLLISNTTPTAAFVTLSGDATLAGTGAITLANTAVTAGAYGSTTAIPVITVDSKGRLTNVTTAAISSAWSSLTNPTANLSLTMGANTSTFAYSATTGTQNQQNTTNSAPSGTTTVNSLGIGLTGTANTTGANTINGINFANVTAATNNTFNGLNFGTGYTNFINSGTVVLTAAGNLSGIGTLTSTTLAGTLSTAAQTNITSVGTLTSLAVTGNINSASGALQTNGVTRIDNSGNLTAAGGTFSGALSGITTLSLSGAITGATATNTINGLIINAGALSGVTTLTASGNLTTTGTVTANSFQKSCPTGYIFVPGDPKFGTMPGFCVMKYDASNDGAGNAVSVANALPWVSISKDTARTTCAAVGNGYHLISEPEWMTIANNVLYQNANWCSSDGSACSNTPGTAAKILAAGHNDNSPAAALTASSNDTQACYGTVTAGTDTTCGSAGTQKRTLTLSNGNIIWDMAGNVWQWTDSWIFGSEEPTTASPGFAWREFTAITRWQALNYANPTDLGWNSTQGLGQIYSDGTSTNTTLYAFLRGGDWGNGVAGGAFAADLGDAPTGTSTAVGFRCAASL